MDRRSSIDRCSGNFVRPVTGHILSIPVAGGVLVQIAELWSATLDVIGTRLLEVANQKSSHPAA
jgi:hypothetical protein